MIWKQRLLTELQTRMSSCKVDFITLPTPIHEDNEGTICMVDNDESSPRKGSASQYPLKTPTATYDSDISSIYNKPRQWQKTNPHVKEKGSFAVKGGLLPGVLALGLSTPFHRDLRLMAEMGIEPEFGTPSRELGVYARAVDEEIPPEYVEVGDCDP